MAPRKKTTAKTAPVSRGRKKSKTAKKPTRITARAHAHTAAIAHERKYHTYTDHRSDSYKHYSSIMKTVILFLGFVLLLAIIANIFAPSINNRPITQTSGQNFLDTSTSGYKAAPADNGGHKQYKYVMPDGSAPSSSSSAPAPNSSDAKTGSSQ